MIEVVGEESFPINASRKILSQAGLATKRIIDITVSGVLLLLLAPFLGLIAIAIKRDTPGPVFYRGPRTGKDGKPFKILKFRTMYESPESYNGPKITAQDDPRITLVGKWLRDTKLNELPQLWNVFVGEMSLVGPRPEDPAIAKTWPLGAREEILSVRPGITSPASVLYHDEESMLRSRDLLEKYLKDLSPNKLRLDQLYVRYHSIWLDFDNLLWTAFILIPRIGSNLPPEELLFLGPISRFFLRYMSWFFLDFLVTTISIGTAGIIWRLSGPLDIGWTRAPMVALGFAFLFSVASAVGGASRTHWDKATNTDIAMLFLPWLIATGTALWIDTRYEIIPGTLVLVSSFLALGGFIATRYHRQWTTSLFLHLKQFMGKSHAVRERVLIVGSGRTAEHISWIMKHPNYSSQFRVLGFIDDDLLAQGLRIYGARIIGTMKDLPQLLKKYDIGLIILADHRISYREFISRFGGENLGHARVVVSPDLYGSINLLVSNNRREDMPGEDKLSGVNELPCRQCLIRQSAREVKPRPRVPEPATTD